MSALTFVGAGTVISVRDTLGRPEKLMVMRHCAHDDRRLHCVPCDVPLANVGNVEIHAAAGGAHQVVSYCRKHCCFESVSTATAQQLAQMTALPAAPAPSGDLS